MNEAQAGDERKPDGHPQNRLSFDFCELSADQLLESTPVSYKIDRANGSVFPFDSESQLRYGTRK